MKAATATAVGIAFGLAATAYGSISYVTQTREHSLNGGAISDAAPDFSPFVSTITDPGPGRLGVSNHASSLTPSGINAAGSVSYSGGGAPDVFSNRIDVFFTVSTAADWNLSGFIDSAGEVNGEENFVEIIFRNESDGPTGSVLFGLDTFDGFMNVDRTVSLVPGNQYRLIISLGGEYFGPSDVMSSYDLSFVPAPGAAAVLGLGGLMALRRRR